MIFYILPINYKTCLTLSRSIFFTSNLQHEIGTEVRYKKPTNLTTAIQIASDYENSKKINQSTEINFIKQRSHESNMNKQKTCYYCKKHGHIKTECRKFKRDQQ
jgi:hypothetical protein